MKYRGFNRLIMLHEIKDDNSRAIPFFYSIFYHKLNRLNIYIRNNLFLMIKDIKNYVDFYVSWIIVTDLN